jgi:hypothetical protein
MNLNYSRLGSGLILCAVVEADMQSKLSQTAVKDNLQCDMVVKLSLHVSSYMRI